MPRASCVVSAALALWLAGCSREHAAAEATLVGGAFTAGGTVSLGYAAGCNSNACSYGIGVPAVTFLLLPGIAMVVVGGLAWIANHTSQPAPAPVIPSGSAAATP